MLEGSRSSCGIGTMNRDELKRNSVEGQGLRGVNRGLGAINEEARPDYLSGLDSREVVRDGGGETYFKKKTSKKKLCVEGVVKGRGNCGWSANVNPTMRTLLGYI